jgi:hypothetical protein
MTTGREFPMIGTKQRRGGLPPEQLAWISAKLGTWTNLQPDLGALSPTELRDLHSLVRLASATENADADRFDPDLLSKRNRRKLEALVEQSAGKPGAFQHDRDMADVRREAAEAVRGTMKPGRRPRWEENGAVVLPKQWAYDYLDQGILFVEHVGLLVAFLSFFENAQLPGRVAGAHFERDGDVLVLAVDHLEFGLDQLTDEGMQWQRLFDHLVQVGFFEAERHGRTSRIRLGKRALAAREGRSK